MTTINDEFYKALEKIKLKLDSTTKDLIKFEQKGVKAAGIRVRKILQEVKKDIQKLRIAINEAKKK